MVTWVGNVKPIKNFNSLSYGPLALILVYTDALTHSPCVNQVSILLPLQFLRKVRQKILRLMEICKTYQGINSKVKGPWRFSMAWFWYTLYNSPLSIGVPSFSFRAFVAPEKSVIKIFLWQIVKPIKGFNSKSYGLLAPILVYTIHQPTVHVFLRKVWQKFFINGKIVKPITGCNSKSYRPLALILV